MALGAGQVSTRRRGPGLSSRELVSGSPTLPQPVCLSRVYPSPRVILGIEGGTLCLILVSIFLLLFCVLEKSEENFTSHCLRSKFYGFSFCPSSRLFCVAEPVLVPLARSFLLPSDNIWLVRCRATPGEKAADACLPRRHFTHN